MVSIVLIVTNGHGKKVRSAIPNFAPLPRFEVKHESRIGHGHAFLSPFARSRTRMLAKPLPPDAL